MKLTKTDSRIYRNLSFPGPKSVFYVAESGHTLCLCRPTAAPLLAVFSLVLVFFHVHRPSEQPSNNYTHTTWQRLCLGEEIQPEGCLAFPVELQLFFAWPGVRGRCSLPCCGARWSLNAMNGDSFLLRTPPCVRSYYSGCFLEQRRVFRERKAKRKGKASGHSLEETL